MVVKLQTKLLMQLLDDIIRINRDSSFYAAFRYGIDTVGKENLAVDLFKDNTNYYHEIATSNDKLKKIIVSLDDVTKSKSKWSVLYSDEYIQIDEVFPSEVLASSRAFLFKQKYNIDVTVKEFLNENV